MKRSRESDGIHRRRRRRRERNGGREHREQTCQQAGAAKPLAFQCLDEDNRLPFRSFSGQIRRRRFRPSGLGLCRRRFVLGRRLVLMALGTTAFPLWAVGGRFRFFLGRGADEIGRFDAMFLGPRQFLRHRITAATAPALLRSAATAGANHARKHLVRRLRQPCRKRRGIERLTESDDDLIRQPTAGCLRRGTERARASFLAASTCVLILDDSTDSGNCNQLLLESSSPVQMAVSVQGPHARILGQTTEK